MNLRNQIGKRFWRFSMWRNGFWEGDQGWANLRFLAVVVVMMAFVAVGAWVEMLMTARLQEPSLGRFILLFFTRGSWRYLSIPLFGLSVAMLVGAHYLQDIYEMPSYSAALHYMISTVFRIGWYPRLTISGGKKEIKPGKTNLLDAVGGPGYVFIAPGSAVLFESLTRPSSIRSEGIHFISRFESIKEIIDLGDQHGTIAKTSAMSKDGIIVTIHDIHFRYRAAGGRRLGGTTGRTPNNPYPFSVQAIHDLVYHRLMRGDQLADWNNTVQNAFDGEILGYIRTHLLDDFVRSGEGTNKAREDIHKNLLSSTLRGNFKRIGTELIWFDIGSFSFFDPVVEEEWIKVWAAPWEGEAAVRRAQGEAQRDAAQLKARSEAQADMLLGLVDELNRSGLTAASGSQGMAKIFLLKVGQVLDAMSKGYQSSPNGG